MGNVIVTGGSRGIGLGIVTCLAKAGHHVMAIARKESPQLREAINEGAHLGSGSIGFTAFDLAETAGMAALVKQLRKELGPIYALVNNAGMSIDGTLALTSATQIEQAVRLNVTSPILLSKYVLRSMMADGAGGRIVNLASIIAFTGYSGLSVYGATKASMIGFTRSLAREVGRTGVTVNAVAPGFVDTEMTKGLTEEQREQIVRRSALRRMVEVSDVASAVEYLLSESARNITGTVITVDAGKHGMNEAPNETGPKPARPGVSVSQAWLRALELTAPIPRERNRVLPTVIDELGHRLGDRPALLSDRECFTYAQLAERARRYARWAIAQGVAKGDVVGLLMPNRPEYLAIWLGIMRVGGVVALLNTNLTGQSLAHCIQAASAKHIIVAAELADALDKALLLLAAAPQVWTHGEPCGLDDEIESLTATPLEAGESREITIDDRALYIYTSGSTGMPKAVNVTHARVMQWGLWFAGMMDAQPSDRLYNCLPMYHSVGGVLAPGAMLAAGGSLVLRERFSASQFWSDVIRWECTAFQYIGELCRYLLHQPCVENETAHRLRLACGNGLAAGVWEAFQQRFRIPQILEFYAATEGGISLFNVQGKPGAIGHIPPYLVHRFAPALVAVDFDKGEPSRDENGFCIRCGVNEPGEVIGKVQSDPASAGSRFEGYTSAAETEKKILHHVFAAGDVWVRTGDLMRQDEKGYFYFVDRIGDTFRWKGENVATCEVAQTLCAFDGILHASVFGVAIPGTEGRAGMAAMVCEGELDLAALHQYLAERLPVYARPLFLRLCRQAELTGTFKYAKTDLVRQGFNPSQCADPLYFSHPELSAYTAIDAPLYDSILAGTVRL